MMFTGMTKHFELSEKLTTVDASIFVCGLFLCLNAEFNSMRIRLKKTFFLQVIILARESGLKLELSDLPVQSLVPEPLKVRKQFCSIQHSTEGQLHH